jgi:hypothetical protein
MAIIPFHGTWPTNKRPMSFDITHPDVKACNEVRQVISFQPCRRAFEMQVGCSLAFLPSSIDHAAHMHPSAVAVIGWCVAMLSFHQDARLRLSSWAGLSQMFEVICLVALVVFGFTHRSWMNFLIVPLLLYAQVRLTTRWWARSEKASLR